MQKDKPIKLIVFRLSALGDVAMTIPVLWSLTRQYPNVQVTFVSKGFTKAIVEQVPNVRFVPYNDTKEHKGLLGTIRFFRQIRQLGPWDGVADMHNVLRTKILRFLFRFTSAKVAYIDKGRLEKRSLTRKKNKNLRQLKHTVVRYNDVIYNLGLGIDVKLDFNGLFPERPILDNDVLKLTPPREKRWVGMAPFAKHTGKEYPFENSIKVIEQLANKCDYAVILFGGKGQEQEKLDALAKGNDNVFSVAGALGFDKELKLMAHLDAMISMDSANMHLATLAGAPVVSIWGATHPYAGFYGWNQPYENAVQTDLSCRPCSVFGNKPCFRHDLACQNHIEPERVVKQVVGIIAD